MWVRAGTDSSTEFRELSQSGIGRNGTEPRELRNQTELELNPGGGTSSAMFNIAE
jgi:hypothetical protein